MHLYVGGFCVDVLGVGSRGRVVVDHRRRHVAVVVTGLDGGVADVQVQGGLVVRVVPRACARAPGLGGGRGGACRSCCCRRCCRCCGRRLASGLALLEGVADLLDGLLLGRPVAALVVRQVESEGVYMQSFKEFGQNLRLMTHFITLGLQLLFFY